MRDLASLAVVLALAVAGCSDVPFVCSEDRQCVRGIAQGRCEDSRRCSFRDAACASGYRFAPFGTDGACVPPPPVCTVAGVTAGANHTCAWFTSGAVSCWGENSSGQLGDGTGVLRSAPRPVEGVLDAAAVGAGANHTCALRRDGSAMCWGENAAQQLGDGTSTMRNVPAQVPDLTSVVDLAPGARHTCALRADGSAACWGRNDRGQLGDGTMTNRPLPVRVTALRTDGAALVAGDSHTCALLRDGGIACWGSNRTGAIGIPLDVLQALAPVRVPAAAAVARLAAGDNHTCAIAQDGRVGCWGLNDAGQSASRGLGRVLAPTPIDDTDSAQDLDAGAVHTCALGRDGSVRCWGSGAWGQLGPPAGMDGFAAAIAAPAGVEWRRVVAGGRHTCALGRGGEVYCWGRVGEGQLGDGTQTLFPVPDAPALVADPVKALAVGGSHTCALTRAGSVWCWGRGDLGQLGAGDFASRSTPVAVELRKEAVQLTAGGDFTCARLVDGTAMCWGRGNRGQLGNGATGDEARPVPVLAPALAHIAAGAEHACAVTVQKEALCWGEAQGNRLGTGAVAPGVQSRPTPPAAPGPWQQVAAGNSHSCAVAPTGGVTCWGVATYGQVGGSASATPLAPTPVAGLPAASSLAAGGDHTCALSSAGTVWCWGRGDTGQLGFGTAAAVAQPVELQRFGAGIAVVTASGNITCAVRGGDRTAHCWGQNRYGQLGNGMPQNRSVPIAVARLTDVTAIEPGDRHACALAGGDGRVYCWGGNNHGQLGLGLPLERAEPRRVDLACP